MSPRARGFSAVTAVIILVMLAVFGAALVTTSVTQQSGAALDLLAPKAYQAARAGVEYGLHRALVGGTCAGTSITFAGDLSGFRADITCASSTHTEATAATPITVYSVTATGCNDTAGCPAASPGAQYVERQLRATAASN
jgi:MSHA biogenesis protein MshP